MRKESDGYNKVAVVLAIIAAFIAFGFIGHSDANHELEYMAYQCGKTPMWSDCAEFNRINKQVAGNE